MLPPLSLSDPRVVVPDAVRRWLKRRVPRLFLVRPWRYWATAIVLVCVFLLAVWMPCDSEEDRLRWAGLWLQVFSLGVVWVGIGKTLTNFNRPTL